MPVEMVQFFVNYSMLSICNKFVLGTKWKASITALWCIVAFLVIPEMHF